MASWKDLKTTEETAAEQKAREDAQTDQIKWSANGIEARLAADLKQLGERLVQLSRQQTTFQHKAGMGRVFLHEEAIGFDLAPDGLSFTFSAPNATERVVYHRHLEIWVRETAPTEPIDVAEAFDRFASRFVEELRRQGRLPLLK